MGRSTISQILFKPRPSVVLLGLVVLVSCALSAGGSPVPDTNDTARNIKDSINEGVNQAKSFFERFKNTFSGKASDEKDGLTPVELAAIIAAAVILLLILPCCICYCLCECVKELICCIFCCGACRD